MIRFATIFFCLLVFAFSIYAQTSETEPNDALTDIGVITISTNGDYTGAVTGSGGGSPDNDFWKLATGSSSVDFNFPDTDPNVVFVLQVFSDETYQTYIGNDYTGNGSDDPGLLALNSSYYYALLVSLSTEGTSDYTITVEGESALPVKLASFSASNVEQGIILEWATETEVDNLGFIIDRSENGNDWATIASYQTHEELTGQSFSSSRIEYSYINMDVIDGKTYYYRLSDVNIYGDINRYSPISVQAGDALLSIPEKTDALPQSTIMDNAYPNPFNPSTAITYHLSQGSQVMITIYDMLGRTVVTLLNGYQSTGSYHINWSGTDSNGAKMPSGVYLVHMQAGDRQQVQKIMMVK